MDLLAAPRLALGCLRLGGPDVDLDGVVAQALKHNIRVFDVAHAYTCTPEGQPGEVERRVAQALRACGALERVVVVTKVGMTRPEGAWQPDGRASTILRQAEESLAELGRVPDVTLLHAVDPRVPLSTQLRALGRALDEGLALAVGVCNVKLAQLEEALATVPLACVQVEWSPFHDVAVRGGVVARALQAGVVVMAHTPFGGPRRAAALRKKAPFTALGGPSVQSGVLTALQAVHPLVLPVAGARSTAAVDGWFPLPALDGPQVEQVKRALGPGAGAVPVRPARKGELRLLMGLSGAGKSRLARQYVERGYVRLNRDERGGTIKLLAQALDEVLASGASEVVADNTFLDRPSRSRMLELAHRHGLAAAGSWLEVSSEDAQVNVVLRQLEAEGRLLTPQELQQREGDLGVTPRVLQRQLRAVEPPALDEGFGALEVVPFARAPWMHGDSALDVVALELLERVPARPGVPRLALAWLPEASAETVATARARAQAHGAQLAVCVHPGGPPTCWCRPPLPGLVLEACHRLHAAPGRVTLHGSSSAHAALARTVGAAFTRHAV